MGSDALAFWFLMGRKLGGKWWRNDRRWRRSRGSPEGDSLAHVHTECSSRLPLSLCVSLSLSIFHSSIGISMTCVIGMWVQLVDGGEFFSAPILGHCFERCCSRDEAVSHILVYSAWYRCDKGLDLSVSMIVGHGGYA